MAQSFPEAPKQKEARRKITVVPSFMTSSSGPLTEELQCCICLDVFTDPVTTPCGHSFCKTCLTECWDQSQDFNCPLCKETFSKRPDLKINTALKQVVQLFKEKSGLTKSVVLCDICDERKLKALKSCLTCQSSYCETHLEPHQRVPRLKKHKLIDSVENLEDYICQEHEKPLELFCRDDQMCVCLFCTVTDHKTHNTVPVEVESAERKAELINTQTEVQQMIHDRIKKIQEIKHSAETRKKNTEQEKVEGVELFTALICSIERCQDELLKMLEEKQKAAEKQAEDLIKELEQEIIELRRRDTELEQLSHTEDHLHLLQVYPSLCSPKHTKNWSEISISTHLSVETLRSTLTHLQETLDHKLSEIELKRIQQHAVNVILDTKTAHPNLIMSKDGKQVRRGDIQHYLPNNPERFDKCPCVLGKEGFSSGRFYFEVQGKGKTDWAVGVVRDSINRKLENVRPSPANGYWILGLWSKDEGDESLSLMLAADSLFTSPSLRVKPEKVGVFVDYEEGLVSFYDVESSSHIYSFTGQSFNEKLYPYFNPDLNYEDKNSAPLIISPIDYNEFTPKIKKNKIKIKQAF